MTETQISAFEAFYRFDLTMGALDFNMPHPIYETAGRFRIVQTGVPYSVTPIGKDAYSLTTTMELLP